MDTHFLESVKIDNDRRAEAVYLKASNDDGTKQFLSYINTHKVKKSLSTLW